MAHQLKVCSKTPWTPQPHRPTTPSTYTNTKCANADILSARCQNKLISTSQSQESVLTE